MKERLFTIVMLLCAFGLNASSQKTATVKSFVQTTDHISGSDRRNDMNGTPCALVKVQVVDDISRVEGNRIGEIVDKGVEKWVYMCKGSRNMRIHLKNHLPVKIMFQDYQINGLESNRVYELVIETPDVSAKLQKLVINYTPETAMVLIDSKPYSGNGRIETELPVGDHRYIIAADGYVTVEGMVKLNEQGAREITEKLAAEKATIPESHVVVPVIATSDNKSHESSYKETHNPQTPPQSRPYPVNGLKRGLRGYVELGYALGLGNYYHNYENCGLVCVAFGYQLNPYLFAGLGAGVGLYDEFDKLGIPVFANVRYTILNKRISPFVDAKGGYSFGDHMKGMYLSPSLGCRFAIRKRMAFTTSVCLEVQEHDNFHGWRLSDRSNSRTALSLGLRIGFEF